MANYYSTDYKKILEEQTADLADVKKSGQGAINKVHDSQIEVENNTYNTGVKKVNEAYADEYQKNAVQKLINEKKIAERNENLGLTDSGLNRTQQTAVQLSYANQKGNIDLAKREKLDELSQKLTTSLASIEQSRVAKLADLDASINSQAQKNAYEIYTANTDANAKIYEADIASSVKAPVVSYGAGMTSNGGYIVSSSTGTLARDYKGSLKDNGVDTVYNYNDNGSIKSVTYTDRNSGMSATFAAGVNPYTGRMHKDVRNEQGEYDPAKAFDNGYQPNNINGIKLKATAAKAEIYEGHEQTIFKCNDEYYVWDGGKSKYKKLTDDEVKEAFPKE